MFNDHGQRLEEVFPGAAVEVLGLTGLPEIGEEFFVIPDEKQARELVSLRKEKERQRRIQPVRRVSLEELHSQIKQGKLKELKIIIKADVAGSLEAVRDCLERLEIPEVRFQIIHAGIGSINTSDAILAKVTDAIILGFHVQPDERAKELIEQKGIETRTYNIIYELIQELKAALEGMLEPKIKKVFLGRLQVRRVFKLSRSGTIAGCIVSKGKILRSATVNLVRNNQIIFEGKITSLKRYKDDVREVAEGFECGISLVGFQDYQEEDIIEAYEIQQIARKL
jgi:translation initiation factor IF-2